jgi:tetratricopeptide (TPR) repeat protein
LDGHIEGLLGYADQALSLIEDARAFARHLNKRFAVAYAEEIGSWTETLRGDFARVRAAAQAGEQLSSELGFSMLRARAKIMGGYARANLGETDGAIDFIRAALAELDLMQAPFHRTFYLAALAETQALAGPIEDALVTVEQALQTNPDELFCRPSTLRLRGELRLRSERFFSQTREGRTNATRSSASCISSFSERYLKARPESLSEETANRSTRVSSI